MKQIIKYLLTISFLLFMANTCSNPTEAIEYSWDYLLTDDELLTEEDPNAPSENTSWSNWIHNNNIPIRSYNSEEFSDLQALKPYLSNKKIVQLGESGHGVRQFNNMKVRLIKYLHEELGFNIIAFESSIFECFYANQKISTFSPSYIMSRSIFGVWHTKEVRQLFDYIKETWETNDPLTLAGFDIQISSGAGVAQRPSFLRSVIYKIDSDYANQIFTLDSEYIENSNNNEYIENNIDSLLSKYNNLTNFFNEHMDTLLELYQDSTEIPMIAKQTAFSIPLYIEQQYQYYINNDYTQSTTIRDKGMADNLIYLADNVYPEEKIIVWAHNFHIRHNNQIIPEYFELKTMGYWLSQYFESEIYTVGLYMYRGEAAMNNGETYSIQPASSGSLESIFYRTRRKYCFLDLSLQQLNNCSLWIFEQITAKSWGTNDLRMILTEQYDGILFIDTVSPPQYINVSKNGTWNNYPTNNLYQIPQ